MTGSFEQPIVLDTNTLLSSILRVGSISEQAVFLATEHFEIHFSDETWRELVDVLHRPKFAKYLQPHQIDALLEVLSRIGVFSKVLHTVVACRDPKDDKFLSLALSVQALVIVSGDKDLLVLHPFNEVAILSPADFVAAYQPPQD